MIVGRFISRAKNLRERALEMARFAVVGEGHGGTVEIRLRFVAARFRRRVCEEEMKEVRRRAGKPQAKMAAD